MLVLSRKAEESLRIGGKDVVIKILGIQGDRVRIGVEAPESVAVRRCSTERLASSGVPSLSSK